MVGKFAGYPVWDRVPPAFAVDGTRIGSELGVAGAHTKREFRSVTERFLIVVATAVGLGLVSTAVGVVITLFWGLVTFGAALAVVGVWMQGQLRDLWSDFVRVSAALSAEQEVGRSLAGLGDGMVVVHSVALADPSLQDVDHVVVGPGGVVVVESRSVAGALVMKESGVWVDGVPMVDLGVLCLRRAEVLRERLGLAATPRVVVAFAGPSDVSMRAPHVWGDVKWVGAGGVAALVRSLVGSGGWSVGDVGSVVGAAARLSSSVDGLVGASGVYLRVVEGNPKLVRWSPLFRVWDDVLGSLPWVGWLFVSLGVLGAFSDSLSERGWVRGPLASLGFDAGAWFVWCAYVAGGVFLVSLLFSREKFRLPFVRLAPFHLTAAGEVPLVERIKSAVSTTPHDETVGPPPPPVFAKQHDVPEVHPGRDRGHQLVVKETEVDARTNVYAPPKPRGYGRMSKRTMDKFEAHAFFEKRLVLPPETMLQVVAVYSMLSNVDAFRQKWGKEPSKGMLLYGPPGTGKTHTARVLAEAAGFEFLSVSPSETRSKWVGESALWIRDLYVKARSKSPSIIFFDEVDGVGAKRGDANTSEANHALNQLLQEIDGLRPTMAGDKPPVVFTMGTTNRLEILDPALRSRLSTEVWIGLPNAEGRKRLWEMHLPRGTVPVRVSLERLAELSERLPGRAIASACTKIAEMGNVRDVDEVDEDLAFEAISIVRSETDQVGADMRP